MKRNLAFLLLFVLVFFALPQVALARSGCCSYHGGVCGCGCCDGTPLSAICAPYYPCGGGTSLLERYVCPTPNLSDAGGSTHFSENRLSCNQNVTIDWKDVTGATDYSLYLSKSIYDEPDNVSDTTESTFTFYQVEAGKKYIHIKAKNSCGWSSSSYWTVDVPAVKPTISVSESIISETERELNIYSSCAKSTSASNIGYIPVSKKRVIVKPKKDTLYSFTAVNENEKATSQILVKYPLPTPTPTNTPTPTPTPTLAYKFQNILNNVTENNLETPIIGTLMAGLVSYYAVRIFKK